MDEREQAVLIGSIGLYIVLALIVLFAIWIVEQIDKYKKKSSSGKALSVPSSASVIAEKSPSKIDPSLIYPEPTSPSMMNIEAKVKYVSEKDSRNLQPVQTLPIEYHYKRKDLIMTQAETRFFQILTEAIGDGYYVFPQVHLSSILEHRIHGQNWWAAFHHINRKSVDFVICDKKTVRPLAAIELDDWSHNLDHRKDRDREVERIFEGAQLPLIRFDGKTRFTYDMLRETIKRSGALPISAP